MTDSYAAHLIIAGIATIFIGTAFIEYQTYIKPARKLADVRASILTNVAKSTRQQIQSRSVAVRLNVQEVFRPFRWLFVRRHFRIIWNDGMQNHPDVGMQLPISCGVVGQCIEQKRPMFADREKLKELMLGLPAKYRDGVSDLTAVMCYPIFEPPRSGAQTGKVLGVLCLDSKAPTAFAKLTEPELFDELISVKLEELAFTAGWLL